MEDKAPYSTIQPQLGGGITLASELTNEIKEYLKDSHYQYIPMKTVKIKPTIQLNDSELLDITFTVETGVYEVVHTFPKGNTVRHVSNQESTAIEKFNEICKNYNVKIG
jgi:hypothetical protein